MRRRDSDDMKGILYGLVFHAFRSDGRLYGPQKWVNFDYYQGIWYWSLVMGMVCAYHAYYRISG